MNIHTQLPASANGVEVLRECPDLPGYGLSLIEQTVKAMSLMVELRDPYTASHQRRVANLAYAIADDLGLGKEACHGIRVGALLHDVGKIRIPAEILSKPGVLTPIEFELVQAHAETGYEILREIAFPWPVASMAYQHHERMNGSGYPLRLRGDHICFESRIIAVADVVEAMASHRPYRPALGIDAALSEIDKGRNRMFDNDVVAACLRVFSQGSFALSEEGAPAPTVPPE